jgi:hypothetical protein
LCNIHEIAGARIHRRDFEDIPGLVKQMAALRMEGTREEGERNRFRLIEENSSAIEKQQP